MKKVAQRTVFVMTMVPMAPTSSTQENLQRGAIASDAKKTFQTGKESPITSMKNQYRSDTCWAKAWRKATSANKNE